jgi:signal transduction protein with GAF and PtsI domain
MMETADIAKLARTIENMREEIALFKAEFDGMSDTELREVIKAQTQIAEDAEWKAVSADIALRLRQIVAAVNEVPHA